MKIVTIIPARSGSKSIPGKNIFPLNGIPLIAYSIDYSLKSSLVDRTVVSTDSLEIADISRKYGAEVPFIRPAEYAMDETPDYPVFRHALDFFEEKCQIYDVYLLLRPTSPLRPDGLIEQAVEILSKDPKISSVRSIAKIKEHPYRSWEIQSHGNMTGFVKIVNEPYNLPRQQLPEVYFQTGDLEAIRRETLLKGSISGDYIFPLIIDHENIVDIDYISDFKKAEGKMKR
ncbi:MAG: acylneuraminate cytidylyltransferase family protein [Spirochaetae bacterium HGW-Spirochaetae-5]|nr:MAG: acylneuraminate cytidylyltransferase family protein [Spirochaetae bacterium HGW-Spirochaetae-5]